MGVGRVKNCQNHCYIFNEWPLSFVRVLTYWTEFIVHPYSKKSTKITPSGSQNTATITFPADHKVLNFFLHGQVCVMLFHWLPLWLRFKKWTCLISSHIFLRIISPSVWSAPSVQRLLFFLSLYSHWLAFLIPP